MRALKSLIDFACCAGAAAVCLPAYASEFYKLSEDERLRVVAQAVDCAGGRLPVIGQVNHASASQAAEWAVRMQELGVAAVGVSVPRLFPLAESDLFRYFDRILSRIEVTLVMQDFCPGGSSVSATFIRDLHRAHPHFRYVKLEEPLMSGKVEMIQRETKGEVEVIAGWGAMYMLELADTGVAAVMPGLALTDILNRVHQLLTKGEKIEAFGIFQTVLPQIVYSLQNLELFHHAEKRLLQARGILAGAKVRESAMQLRPDQELHIAFLNERILALLDNLNLARNPTTYFACGMDSM